MDILDMSRYTWLKNGDACKYMKKIMPAIILILILSSIAFVWKKSDMERFAAPRTDAPMVEFRISKVNTITAVTGNLHYYGFVKNEQAFLDALRNSKDNAPGREGAIKVGNNTIDTESSYDISQSMTAWEIANILLNQGTPSPSNCDHGCPNSHPFTPELLPGGEIAPTLKERMQVKYEWIKTYEDCADAIGSDGGQLSSEQYYERTGIKLCVSPDGREFTQGKEGWSDQPSP